MTWLVIALIIVALVFVFYVIPFILIIRWYNNAVRRQFRIICSELNLGGDALVIYRNGAFVYPTIQGRTSRYDFSLTSEAGASFTFTAGKARTSGRQVVTKLVFRMPKRSVDMTISLIRQPSGTAVNFNECFKIEGPRFSKLSPAAEAALMACAEDFGKSIFPIQIRDGSIIIRINDMIWTTRKRERAIRAIQLAEQLTDQPG